MLSIATGHDVGYLTNAVAGGREGYYSGAVNAGEPPGLWFGAGADELGLRGQVDADLMEAIYARLLDPRDPASHNRETWAEAEALAPGHRAYRSADAVYVQLLQANPDAGPERRAELRAVAERSARQAVSFIDVTFSAPKSVTVLAVAFERAANEARAAGRPEEADAWQAHTNAVEDAMLTGSRAALNYLQDQAGYSRVGHHGGGAGRWVDAHEFVVAQFLQHDSRDRDPQLHVHNAILNRVRCGDGTWRTLDSRAIHGLRGAASAIGERVMEAHLARTLGVRFETRPDGRAREVIGVPGELTELFSSRRRALTDRASEMVREFSARYGRPPSPAERFYIAQQATLSTRPAKRYAGETREQQLDRWTAQCRDQVAGGLAQVAHDVLSLNQQATAPAEWSPRDVIARALAAVAETSQTWSRSTLMRAISDALPGNWQADADQVRPILENLTDQALAQAIPVTQAADTTNMPADELLADGRSPYASPTGQLYTVAGTLAAEHGLRAAAVERGAARLPAGHAQRVIDEFAAAGRTLGPDQAAAVRGVLTSGARVEVLSAAPGTGKSFVVGTLAAAWTEVDGRRVFGLTPSQVAADVLAGEGVSAAANTTAWLGAQRRLDTAHPDAHDRFGDEAWRLRAGDLVVVDEANMAATGQLAEIQQRCAAADAKLLLAGDPAQLAAVGPGGALADVAEHGIRYELADVRRFTADWERTASLRLRAADPNVLGDYDKHGRLRDGGTAEQAEAAASRAWLADTLTGRESLLLVRDNAAAARVSAAMRAELVSLGRVEETGVGLGMDGWHGVTAGVGDLVQARRNGRELVGFDGNTTFPVNRKTYRVTAIRADGGLTVTRTDEPDDLLQLPPDYVGSDLALGYASTVHAAEGRTVDTAHAVITPGTDPAGLLVALTRGRDGNTAWTVTRATAPDSRSGETHTVEPRTARAVLSDILETATVERTATAQREQAEFDAASMMTHVDQLIDVISRHITAGRTGALLDELAAQGHLTPEHRATIAADDAFGALDRLIRTAELAGHDPRDVLTAAVQARSLDDARSPAQVLHTRISRRLHNQIEPSAASVADLIPRDGVPDQWAQWLHDRADAADNRRRELGAQLADQADQLPAWAERALGPVPDDSAKRQDWEHRAGVAAAYRELVDHTDDTDALGPVPTAGLAEKQALYRAAHDALDLVDRGYAESNMSEGQLRARSAALTREETWAPQYVADQLAVTRQRADNARADAAIWTARAEHTDDPTDSAALRHAAERATQEADALGQRAQSLEAADEIRADWFAHTAVTRDNATRARAELASRGIDVDSPDDRVTAQGWWEAHLAEQADADLHREIRDDHDFAHDQSLDTGAEPVQEAEAQDIRDLSTAHASEYIDADDRYQVPSLEETVQIVARAQTALAEIGERARAEERENERLTQLGQWNHDARTAGTAAERHDDMALDR